MKRFSVILLVFTLIATLSVSVIADERVSSTAEYGTPVVDGVIDDVWANAAVNTITELKTGTQTELTAQFRALWDDNYFYLLIEANDGTPYLNAFDSADAAEIYLDPMHLMSADNTPETIGGVFFNSDSAFVKYNNDNSIIKLENAYMSASTMLEGGYILEIQLDLKQLAPEVSMASGTVIGLEVQMNDYVEIGGGRTAAYGWADFTDQAWCNPSSYGEIEFVQSSEAAAPVEEAPAETAAPVEEAPEAEAPVTEAAVETAPVTTAPQTFDYTTAAFVGTLIALSALCLLTAKKNAFNH